MQLTKLFFTLAILMAAIVAIIKFSSSISRILLWNGKYTYLCIFTYPITFLITDLANRKYGKFTARKIVYLGFFTGIILTIFFSTNFDDLISIRIAIGSGTAFLVAQLLDVSIFDLLRKKFGLLLQLYHHHLDH